MEQEQESAFDVAIWPTWPLVDGLPLVGMVRATDAGAAVVAVMRAFGLMKAAHVAAACPERSLVHRAYGVTPPEEPTLVPAVKRRAGAQGGRAGSRTAHQASWELEASRLSSRAPAEQTGASDAALAPLTER